jgi:hypothetical protein
MEGEKGGTVRVTVEIGTNRKENKGISADDV